MAYKAVKTVTIEDKTYNPGDYITEDVNDRLILANKVEIVDDVKVVKEQKVKKNKKQKITKEILTEDSAEVSVEIEENA